MNRTRGRRCSSKSGILVETGRSALFTTIDFALYASASPDLVAPPLSFHSHGGPSTDTDSTIIIRQSARTKLNATQLAAVPTNKTTHVDACVTRFACSQLPLFGDAGAVGLRVLFGCPQWVAFSDCCLDLPKNFQLRRTRVRLHPSFSVAEPENGARGDIGEGLGINAMVDAACVGMKSVVALILRRYNCFNWEYVITNAAPD
ncbi:hypothetical protein CPB85DRAFT_1254420 [Mucidula mucida]|nr:hypothetical protein CPB85DRAFT_1254420 [Mucidula mucida]